MEKKQVGQLSQTNCAAGWVSFGKNVSGRGIVYQTLKIMTGAEVNTEKLCAEVV